MISPVRLRCMVPFCSHTRGRRKGDRGELVEGSPWLCGAHWRLVPRERKRRWDKLGKLWDKAVAKNRPKAVKRLRRIYWQVWDGMVAIAIEISAGITSARPTRRASPKTARRRPR